MDIDLEEAEALVNAPNEQEQQEEGQRGSTAEDLREDRDDKKNKKKKHHRSKSRSRSGKKHKSKKNRSKSRSRSGKKKSKKQSKSPRKEKKSAEKQSGNNSDQQGLRETVSEKEKESDLRMNSVERIEQKKRELELQIEKLNKEADEAQREDMTVMMYQVPLKADEKDIWRFLTKHCLISKVRDIKLIRDQKTKRSKGVAYAEFYVREDLDKALSSDTKPFFIKGEEVPMSEVRFAPSQAEKNRAAVAARQIKLQRTEALKEQLTKLQEGPVKILVSGLNGKLSEMTSNELKDIFQQFGEIESVELPQSAQGVGLGSGYIVFKKKSDAHDAIQAMNGIKLHDQHITCTPVANNLTITPAATSFLASGANPPYASAITTVNNDKIDLDQNENNIYLHSTQKRLELMMKLAGNNLTIPGLEATQVQVSNNLLPIPGINNLPSLNIASNQMVQDNFLAGNRPPTSLVPTNYVALINMFSENDYKNDNSFFADLKEDVGEECKKYKELVDVFVATTSPCGAVFVIFKDPMSAVSCAKNMDGRIFNGRAISSYCISEETLKEELQQHE